MKKNHMVKYAVIVAVMMSLGMVTACKNNTSDAGANTSESSMSEENMQTEVPLEEVDVKLGDYKNIEVEIDAIPEVTDVDVEEQISSMIQSMGDHEIDATTPIKDGDSISINFERFCDGESLGDAQADYYLTVGSGVFLEDKESEFVGKCGGDTLEIAVDYDADYPVEDIAGKKIIYKISINGIVSDDQKQPELTDELVASISDCKTVDEFREMIRKQMIESAQMQRDSQATQAIWQKIMEDVQVDGYPESVRQQKIEAYKKYDEESAQVEGLTLEQYADQYLQMTMDEYDQNVAKIIDDQIKYNMAVQEIAKQEGLSIDHLTDADWQAYAEQYQYDSVDELKQNYTEEDMIMQIEVERVNDYLLKTVKITEKSSED